MLSKADAFHIAPCKETQVQLELIHTEHAVLPMFTPELHGTRFQLNSDWFRSTLGSDISKSCVSGQSH